MTNLGGIILFGPQGFWFYFAGGMLAFAILKVLTSMHDSKAEQPRFNELITWFTLISSWLGVLSLLFVGLIVLLVDRKNGYAEE